MAKKTRHLGTGILLGVVLALLLLFLAAIGVAYSGAYDVGATRGHSAGIRWLLDTTMHASVRAHSAGSDGRAIPGTPDLANGAGEFKAMCEHCHGGPGVDPQPWSRGMLPQPPHLAEEASEWNARELAWIIGNGIRYTGMPAFGSTHDEATVQDIAAFVEQLPGMTPAQYAASAPAHDHGSPAVPAQGHRDAGHQH